MKLSQTHYVIVSGHCQFKTLSLVFFLLDVIIKKSHITTKTFDGK